MYYYEEKVWGQVVDLEVDDVLNNVPEFLLKKLHINNFIHNKGFIKIKKVIFNPPATIVYWEDGSKTVVKCFKDDIFDKEKGLAMCICKKIFCNDSEYHKFFRYYCSCETPKLAIVDEWLSVDTNEKNGKICNVLDNYENERKYDK